MNTVISKKAEGGLSRTLGMFLLAPSWRNSYTPTHANRGEVILKACF